jgi:hypothetical protein
MAMALVSCGGGSVGSDPSSSAPAAARQQAAAATAATFPGVRANYTITRTSTGYNVRDNASGANTLVGGNLPLTFSDVTVNTMVGAAAGSISAENLRVLTELYIAFFNRIPDADGLTYWIGQFNAGQTISQIANGFYAAALQYSSTTGYTAGMTNADFVKIVYKNVLGRTGTLAPPDTDVQYWAAQLDSGQATRGTLVATMLTSAHAYAFDATWSWVSTLLVNKVSVANTFAVQQGLNFNSADESIARTVAIAAMVTATSKAAALTQIGIRDSAFDLTSSVCGQGVTTGYAGSIESAVANSGCAVTDNSGAGDSGSGSGGGGSGAGGGLGKVLGGLMTVQDLFDGTVIGQAATDTSNGMVTVKTGTRIGPFLLTLEGRAGAKYFDEGLNQLLDFGPGNVLHALVDKWDEHVGVSPLTEAAYRYALNNFKLNPADVASGKVALASTGDLTGVTADQVRTANNLIAAAINQRLTSQYQLASAKALPTPIDASSGSAALPSSRYGVSAAVNGGLVRATNDYNPGIVSPAVALANDLARDFTDGRIDGFVLDGSPVAAGDKASYTSVRLPLAGKIGTDAVTTRFGASTLLPSQLTINEESSIFINGGPDALYVTTANQWTGFVPCDGFYDNVALMSDGSVTVVRHFPTNTNGACAMTYSPAENAREVKMTRFMTDVKLLSRGGPVTFAVKTDGTVWGWGENYCGRLSPAMPNGIYSRAQLIPGLRDITAITGDLITQIARDKSGAIYTWGPSAAASSPGPAVACGTGAYAANGTRFSYTQSNTVFTVSGVPNVVDVYASSTNFFMLTASGDVYGWGAGYAGLLANSGGAFAANSNGKAIAGPAIQTPTKIAGLTGVRKLVFAGNTAFALQANGVVKAWGNDEALLVGNGRQLMYATPTPIPGLTDIANMEGDCCGLRLQKSDGSVIVWGNGNSLLPDTNKYYTPTVFTPPERIRHIAARSGGYSVYFASGKVGRDVNQTGDVTPQFR